MEKDAITQLNDMAPAVRVQYTIEEYRDGFLCKLVISKDKEIFDFYGKRKRKQEAKMEAAVRALALLKLPFPLIPFAMFNRVSALESVYTHVSDLQLGFPYTVYHLKELRNGMIYVYLNKEKKQYVVVLSSLFPYKQMVEPDCPLELLNDPIRYTDWSIGPLIPAQENYISHRLELIQQ